MNIENLTDKELLIEWKYWNNKIMSVKRLRLNRASFSAAKDFRRICEFEIQRRRNRPTGDVINARRN